MAQGNKKAPLIQEALSYRSIQKKVSASGYAYRDQSLPASIF